MGEVKFTSGFWADRFARTRDVSVPQLWATYTDPNVSHSFRNFEIAAGLKEGNFKGPSFHDGDFYKTLEAMASLYAVTKEPSIDRKMDEAIEVIGKAQRSDGYLYTKSIIEQKQSGRARPFDDKLSFEAYNFGHLMTAASVHHRATGKKSLLHIAEKAARFLDSFYRQATPEQTRNAICPSHYMGLVELYRTTRNKEYLDLAKRLIDLRGTVEGTDDNSDRAPFREMKKVVGHAVRANYLFAGVADVFAENGDSSLFQTLGLLWDNVTNRKMYITGGCGALYDGVSVDGTSYKPDTVQKVHQSYGRDYQLPNHSAHNETCANIGNLLWNWRMFLVTGEAKYMDVAELVLYNSILSGISVDGEDFFYTNPLAASRNYPYSLRWQGGRKPYIALSNCCPPNTVRTLAQVGAYFYSLDNKGININLYGGSTLSTVLKNGSPVSLEQKTDYPWTGSIRIEIKEAPKEPFSIGLRIPAWSGTASIRVNGVAIKDPVRTSGYQELERSWKKGDYIELELPMEAVQMEANPLVEEVKSQVAIKRGPLVYCLESTDLPAGTTVAQVQVPLTARFRPEQITIGGLEMTALKGEARMTPDALWQGGLYRPKKPAATPVPVRLVPYFAWSNRGASDMSVWLSSGE